MREREKGHCLLVVTAACDESEEDKRSLPLRFPYVVFLSHSDIFYSLCAAVVFPTFGFSTLISGVSSLCAFDFVLCILIWCILPTVGCGRTN